MIQFTEKSLHYLALRYADDFAPSIYPFEFGNTPGVLKLDFIDDGYYSNTTLTEALVGIGVSPDPGLCNSSVKVFAPKLNADSIDVNGIHFTRIATYGAGAGSMDEVIFHRVVHNNKCYEIVYAIHSVNIGNYLGTGANVVEFDRQAVMKRMEDILASFTFIN